MSDLLFNFLLDIESIIVYMLGLIMIRGSFAMQIADLFVAKHSVLVLHMEFISPSEFLESIVFHQLQW